ncbi:formylglycine-generating enzyme family protein [Candidatus Parabeggiatoa sp. HSG14]|uniref:formylglycine-generating enzyme family protein n=1 Tax=Candidatus Parabeggiatoa sp. HSG14 TaxID=3055593 RepID=UPI0025A83E70|nr:formylglycine-generating enzyme family protein [Thiotrichales bacterium HSG14]
MLKLKNLILLLLLIITQTVNAANAELSFTCLKSVYEVGEYAIIDLQENLQAPPDTHQIDLWVAIQTPGDDLLFITSSATHFSLEPQLFKSLLDNSQKEHRILEFEIPAGLGGDYTLYALYVEKDKNPLTDDSSVHRSNLATATITLANQQNSNNDNSLPQEKSPCLTSLPLSANNNEDENIPDNVVKDKPDNVFQDRLQDGSLGPDMIVIPTGTFKMGDIQDSGDDSEKPVHQVSIKSFAMGRYEVTNAEFVQFANSIKSRGPDGQRWFLTKEKDENSHIVLGSSDDFEVESGYKNHPVLKVSWYGAVAYTEWLSQQTGKQYRLPSEAEWEYAARAGTDTEYWWGNDIGSNRANCKNSACGDRFEKTAPVGSFKPNPFGLYDTAGNLWELVADSWHDNYEEAPTDGSVWIEGDDSLVVVRGGSWYGVSSRIRSANRINSKPSYRFKRFGFRLARE